jgi:regulator of protease activity HflC (stomatin/prohibitin superfamily)
MKRIATLGIVAAAILATGCTRIETGEVGIRVGFDKQVKQEELMPGSWNQILIGDVLTFSVKDVQVDVADLTPLASDNSTVKDFDVSVIYSVNPSNVAEMWVDKNKSFHARSKDGDILLMYNYVYQVARNAAYKSARKYESLKMADNRAQIEMEIREEMVKALAAEKLDTGINVQQVLIRNIMPADNIIESANALVQAQNELKKKQVEVETAKKEAERIAALNANKGAVEYMQAMAMINISEGIRDGKVQTIVVPANFNALMLGGQK